MSERKYTEMREKEYPDLVEQPDELAAIREFVERYADDKDMRDEVSGAMKARMWGFISCARQILAEIDRMIAARAGK